MSNYKRNAYYDERAQALEEEEEEREENEMEMWSIASFFGSVY